MAHGLDNNAELHFEIIPTPGIIHMIYNHKLYTESLGNESREHYIWEIAKQATWCDNIIIQSYRYSIIQINQ